jgi:hypothetical protein
MDKRTATSHGTGAALQEFGGESVSQSVERSAGITERHHEDGRLEVEVEAATGSIQIEAGERAGTTAGEEEGGTSGTAGGRYLLPGGP